ncbi:hypothetical protein ACJIZ3_019851 [Penstemon smallii]|uniref:Transposase-associated domain-containing protein n=1 Tax=Penstemon smallii TaxID=265156 RepID=A0ABD3T2B7_9LAMI
MDKSWIDLESKAPAYLRGIDAFLDFAFKNRPNDTTISCPCEKCDNRYFKSRMDIRDHCFFNGFSKNYKNWTYHGESYVPVQRPTIEASRFQNNELRVDNEGDNIVGLLYEAMGMQRMSDNEMNDGESSENNDLSGANKETLQFYQMLEDASLELYPGCAEFTKFSFINHLLNLKVISGSTNTSFTLLLNLLEKAFPKGVNLPKDFNEANKITTKLGFTYETWDACPNNCMLFRNQDEFLEACEICGTSRYKEGDKKIATKK